jgi:hypothetical protein
MARKRRGDDEHDHEHDHDHGRDRRDQRSVGGWVSNWNEYEASTGTKLALAARNLFVSRWHNRLMCCGHPGQPGC